MVQVLIFRGEGYDKAEGKSCKEGVCSTQLVLFVDYTLLCMCQQLYTYFGIQGPTILILYLGGMYFRGIAADSKFQRKMTGHLFSKGTYLRGFSVILVKAGKEQTQESANAEMEKSMPAFRQEKKCSF